MLKKWKYLSPIIISFLIILAWHTTRGIETIGQNTLILSSQPDFNDQIEEQHCHKDGIEANYPSVISGSTKEKLKKWNSIITGDFNKILQIYSFNPFPELQPTPTGAAPVILNVDYDLKLNNSQLASIFYKAAFNSPYSAHPTELVYTTNIDKRNDKRLRLSDMVKLNADFAKDFKSWDFKTYQVGNEVLNNIIRDYIKDMSVEDLLQGFESADQIGSDNLWGVFSYLTHDRLGISVSVPNYIGDHVEFEKNYSEIEDYLKPVLRDYIR